MAEIITQSIGYVASLLLALSLLVNNDIKFRWLNTLGCVSFIIYGIFIHAFPIILTNTILFLINAYYLIKLNTAKEDFELIEFKCGEKLVYKFLSFYAKDINNYFPEYIHEQHENNLSFVVLRDLVIANIFIARLDDNGNAFIKLNYTVAKYRDYKVGKFIFEKEKTFLISKGVHNLIYEKVANKSHERFLKVMGFVKQSASDVYIKSLN